MPGGKEFPVSLVLKAVDRVTAVTAKVSAAIVGLADTAKRAGGALTLGLSAPLAAIGAASISSFGQFEKGMASVSTLIDTNVENIDEMGKAVLAIGRRVPVGIGDLTEALASARGAGVTAAEQFKVLEGSARLGAAALGTTAEAVDIATSAINAWGLKGKEADGVYNLVFQAVNTGKMTLSQLAQGFGGVAGTVASANVKLDEYLASVAALTTTGLPAAEAHTQLRAVLSGLTRQSKLTSAVFHKLGAKDLKELIAESGGLVPALERIKGVLKGNDTMMLNLLGSTEALNAVLGLTGNQAGAFKGALDTMRSGVDGVSVAFDKQNKTGAATLQRLQNSLEGVAISVGRVLVPALEQLAPLLERAATWWEGLGGESQRTIIIIGAAAAALGPTLTVLGNLAVAVRAVSAAFVLANGWAQYLWMMRASIMAALVPSLSAAAASVWGFTVALLANPITWVVAGVAALAGAAYLIYENWEPIKAFFADLWAGIVSAFVRAWDTIRPIAEKVQSAISYTPLGMAMKGGMGIADGIAERARPTLGAERAMPPGGQAAEARVTVDFANAPKGTRVTPAPGNTAPVDINLGFTMQGPT